MLKAKKFKYNLGKKIFNKSRTNIKAERKIEIVFATDDNYVQHCLAAICSILLNSDSSSSFRFHILDGGITDINKNNFLKLKKTRDFEIIFYNMKKYDFSQFPLNRDYISEATYYRLILLDLLEPNIDKVIYLDCDIIVEKDLKELWDIDISNYMAGVVEDEGSITQLKRLGLPTGNSYFNAGVIVFNISKLRSFDLKNKCIEYYHRNEDKIILQDQDMLNGVLNGLCKFLPLYWNTNGRIYNGNELEYSYSKDEELFAKYNPGIIHYTDVNKPWHINCTHPLKKEYTKYVLHTPIKFQYIKNSIKQFLTKNTFNLYNETVKNSPYKEKVLVILGIKIRLWRKRS